MSAGVKKFEEASIPEQIDRWELLAAIGVQLEKISAFEIERLRGLHEAGRND